MIEDIRESLIYSIISTSRRISQGYRCELIRGTYDDTIDYRAEPFHRFEMRAWAEDWAFDIDYRDIYMQHSERLCRHRFRLLKRFDFCSRRFKRQPHLSLATRLSICGWDSWYYFFLPRILWHIFDASITCELSILKLYTTRYRAVSPHYVTHTKPPQHWKRIRSLASFYRLRMAVSSRFSKLPLYVPLPSRTKRNRLLL